MNAKAIVRFTLVFLGLMGLAIGLQMLISSTTTPQTANAGELISRQLAKAYESMTLVTSALISAIGTALIRWIFPGSTNPAQAPATTPESASAKDAEFWKRVAKAQAAKGAAVAQQLRDTQTEVSELQLQNIDMCQRLVRNERHRAVLVIAILSAIWFLVAAICEVVVQDTFGLSLPGFLANFMQSTIVCVGTFAIGLLCVYRFQLRVRSVSSFDGAMVGLLGVACAGLISLVTISPAMFKALSPIGWDVPIGSTTLPIFYFLCISRLVLFPICGCLGALIGHHMGTGELERLNLPVVAAISNPELKPGQQIEPKDVQPARKPADAPKVPVATKPKN